MRNEIISVLVLLVLFTGCSSVLFDDESSTVSESTENQSIENMVCASANTELSVDISDYDCIYERQQDQIEAAWEERLMYFGSGIDEILMEGIVETGEEVREERLLINSNYSNLANTVDQQQQDIINSIESDDYNINSTVYRCDNRLISVGIGVRTWSGDDYQRSTGYYTWDYEGNMLCFTDVIRDYSVFVDTIRPLIVEAFADDANNVDGVIDSLNNNSFPDNIDYYMTYDSLRFFCGCEDGTVARVISVSYRDYADLFNPEYLPGEGLMISVLSQQDMSVNDGCINQMELNGHDTIYNRPIGSVYLISNYNGADYILVAYAADTYAELCEYDECNSLGFLLVLYDVESENEIGSRAMDNISGYSDSNLCINQILDFIDDQIGY